MVKSAKDAADALAALSAMDVIGFDTESKPTFVKGKCRPARTWCSWQPTRPRSCSRSAPSRAVDVLKAVLESASILKVGFGLQDDVKRLRAKLGIEAANVLDLSTALRKKNERNTLGAKTAVARYFGQTLQKSKKITTTNWALPRLSEKQILYAADDAHVALKIYRHWRAAT
ncbi:3'-5' exonuclease domain-containing protein 2 [Massilia sp. B-10]|nr:3'-5' exonuclease domain-containing protein 2 [Massilia sp. B-10]